jgi:signal transduction histidine kinase
MSGEPAPPPGSSASALRPQVRLGGWRDYGLAWVVVVVGLALSAAAGAWVDRWAKARDEERFDAECRLTVEMVQQKMERYESGLARLRDLGSRYEGEIPNTAWYNWVTQVLDAKVNYPAVRILTCAPKVTVEKRAEHEARGLTNFGGVYAIATTKTNAAYWLPLWSFWVPKDGMNIPTRTDLGDGVPGRASFSDALGVTFGWISERPVRAGDKEAGFWFIIPLSPDELRAKARSALGKVDDVDQRHRIRTERASGVLAALISGDRFLREFNAAARSRLLQVQLFTHPQATPRSLLNPRTFLPAEARFTKDIVMSWYTRRWTLRCHSTALFEGASLRYRAWLVAGMGCVLSLGAAGAVASQTRGRRREAALAGQLRETLGRQERLSRDLHDGTLQSVYGVGLGLQRAERLLEKRSAEAGSQLAGTRLAMQRVVEELRAFIRQSDPTLHEEVPFGEALRGVVNHLKSATEMELELDLPPGVDRGLTAGQSLQLLNLAREALSNSIRHSRGHKVRVALGRTAEWLRLEITDDGCGFDPGARHEGRGLANLTARVREIGATQRWETAPGRGARLIIDLPLRDAA